MHPRRQEEGARKEQGARGGVCQSKELEGSTKENAGTLPLALSMMQRKCRQPTEWGNTKGSIAFSCLLEGECGGP